MFKDLHVHHETAPTTKNRDSNTRFSSDSSYVIQALPDSSPQVEHLRFKNSIRTLKCRVSELWVQALRSQSVGVDIRLAGFHGFEG